MTDIVANMEALARKWHEGSYRRGPERLPYIVHPAAVVGLLKEWGYNEGERGEKGTCQNVSENDTILA